MAQVHPVSFMVQWQLETKISQISKARLHKPRNTILTPLKCALRWWVLTELETNPQEKWWICCIRMMFTNVQIMVEIPPQPNSSSASMLSCMEYGLCVESQSIGVESRILCLERTIGWTLWIVVFLLDASMHWKHFVARPTSTSLMNSVHRVEAKIVPLRNKRWLHES